MKEDSLKKRYGIKLFASIMSGLIGAILIAIVPKALGPIAYGQFIYLQDFFMKIIGFLDMGSSIAFFTKLSANQQRKELISFYAFYAFMVFIGMVMLIGILNLFGYLPIVVPDIPHHYVYMGFLYGFLLWLTQLFMKISDAYALTVSVELIKIIHKIITLCFLFFLISFSFFDLERYFYFHYISLGSFLFILIYLFIRKNILSQTIFTFNFRFISLSREFIAYCAPLVSSTFLSIGVGLFDIWLLQKMAGSIQTGFYGLAYSIAAICFLFTSAMTPIITREFAKAYGEDDLKKMRQLFFRYIPMLYAIAAYFGVFISFQSENLLTIFTDESFKNAYLVLFIMAFYPIHQTYGQLSGSVFYATEQTKKLRNIIFITQPIGLLLSFAFIYVWEYEAVGLALKMILGQIISVNLQLYYNARFLNFKMKYFVKHQIVTVLFFMLFAFVASHLVYFASALLSFLISGMLYTILVIIFAYIFPYIFATNRSEIRDYLQKVRHVIKK